MEGMDFHKFYFDNGNYESFASPLIANTASRNRCAPFQTASTLLTFHLSLSRPHRRRSPSRAEKRLISDRDHIRNSRARETQRWHSCARVEVSVGARPRNRTFTQLLIAPLPLFLILSIYETQFLSGNRCTVTRYSHSERPCAAILEIVRLH